MPGTSAYRFSAGLLLAAGLAAPAHAGALDRLRDALRNLEDSSPVRAQLERQVTYQDKDQEKKGSTTVIVSLDGDGLQIAFPAEQLRKAEAEHAQADPDAPSPVSDGLHSIDPVAARAMLGFSKRLLADLERATLVSETPASYRGTPTRLLELDVQVKLDKGDRKHIKDAHSTMKIWCGPEGLPLALEQHTELHGRIFLIIGFEIHDSRSLQFARSGNRLVVLRDETSGGGSGLGESADQTLVTTLKLL